MGTRETPTLCGRTWKVPAADLTSIPPAYPPGVHATTVLGEGTLAPAGPQGLRKGLGVEQPPGASAGQPAAREDP